MSSLENLTAKILQDSESKAESILENARAEGDRIIAKGQAEANTLREQMLSQGSLDAERSKSQIINGETLRLRDLKLKAKQETIDNVFAKAVDELNNNMTQEQYMSFLEKYLVDAPINGTEEVVFPKRFKNTDLSTINKKRIAAGKVAQLSPSKEDMQINGGFVLIHKGAINKFTFESLLDFYRDELEHEIVNKLF